VDQTIPVTDIDRLRQATVLYLVEDDAATREAVKEFLTGRGMTVEAFENCEAFLAHAPSVSDGYLLLDYHFSGMDGFQLMDVLRERGTTLPVIFYTGRFDHGLKRRAEGYPEVIAFLQKPLGGQSLLDSLQDAFRSNEPLRKSP
jgi:two-component system CheB/CheR fusion protein